MKKILFFILVTFLSVASYSQSVIPIRADTTVFKKVGGNANIRLENSTRALKGGVVYNVDGKGTFAFAHSRKSGDTLFIGGDTILNIGSGGDGPGGDSALNLYVENGLYAPNDSTIRIGVNPLMENTKINGQHLFSWLFDSVAVNMNSGRFAEAMGTSTAAANDLSLPADGNLFPITGHTTINAIATAAWQAGSEIGFVFADTPIIKHNTAGGGGTAKILLSGGLDYKAAPGDYLAVRYDGTNWHETARKFASSSNSLYGFDAVLSVNQAISINRIVSVGANTISFSGSGNPLSAVSSAGSAGTFTGAVSGVLAASPLIPFWGTNTSTSNNTVEIGMLLQRTAATTPSSGEGLSLNFDLRNSLPSTVNSLSIENILTTVTNGAERSKLNFKLIHSGALVNVLTVNSFGIINAPGIANWVNAANNAAAITAGAETGDYYRNGDAVQVVH